MKEQIEEKHALSESIYMSGHGLDWRDSDDIAEQLYTEGYRKQSEGEWIERAKKATSAKGIEVEHYINFCSKCGYEIGIIKYRHKYCPNCGAKMKGGA